MSDISDCGLLIIAYARSSNVKDIVRTAEESGVKRIYIALDISSSNPRIQDQQESIERLISDWNSNQETSIKLLKRNTNVGCSANLLSGIDWAFEFEDYLAIVEDDCLPVTDFYSLVAESRIVLETNSNIWIVSGTQVMPTMVSGQAVLSRYPITWGWATTRSNWEEIRSALIAGAVSYRNFRGSGLPRAESLYWRTGARRSYSGIIDAWDIPFALAFIECNKLCLLPSESLVKNVGDDIFALHTNLNSPGIRLKTGNLKHDLSNLQRSLEYESWIRVSHYGIRKRFLLTNRLRYFTDFVSSLVKKDYPKPLLQRWFAANI